MNCIEHSLPYSRQLDALRGISIFLVLFFHLWRDLSTFGFAGVDILLILSGYLIIKIIVKGKFSFSEII
jgi:peptidoglycan/LPS O-acetylase OafA/YrhL